MPRTLILEFTKMNGAGNDFIVVDNRFYAFSDEELAALARRYCPRRVGIGADGLLALAPAQQPEVHYRMRYFNADGSPGTMCGNGARCLARFAQMAGIQGNPLCFETDAGRYQAEVPDDPQAPVRLYLPPVGPCKMQPPLATPLDAEVETAAFIWTGTEHLVCRVSSVETVPIARWGPLLRHDAALQPRGANVNFVEVAGEQHGRSVLRVRTYEKGVEAETLACGTGAVAAALVAWRQGWVRQLPIEVHMPGGVLTVGFQPAKDGETALYLEGPATVVFRGTVEVPVPLVS
ncbi:diaminopimelate epimerase [Rhodothermus profundi]|uniref:Diaminopimelate epimerase n=1 Tax=Rhodothermus profundi TaxID=633813 RepID=A0A1M6QL78_9BACT|nr:diaminopimelate epimerase [Rhodothermus profundi]SHK20803.1 diaminopimelate epimerase [Rhodothermus profundi]